jgi:hypothetical protein
MEPSPASLRWTTAAVDVNRDTIEQPTFQRHAYKGHHENSWQQRSDIYTTNNAKKLQG